MFLGSPAHQSAPAPLFRPTSPRPLAGRRGQNQTRSGFSLRLAPPFSDLPKRSGNQRFDGSRLKAHGCGSPFCDTNMGYIHHLISFKGSSWYHRKVALPKFSTTRWGRSILHSVPPGYITFPCLVGKVICLGGFPGHSMHRTF